MGFADLVNANPGGFNRVMGVRVVSASEGEVVAELAISEIHLQPYGIVHGGVYAALVETCCSLGAALVGLGRGQTVVGLENSTSLIHGAREGRLVARARPLSTGRRSQVWACEIRDDGGRLAAEGRLRLLCLEGGAEIAGREVKVEEV